MDVIDLTHEPQPPSRKRNRSRRNINLTKGNQKQEDEFDGLFRRSRAPQPLNLSGIKRLQQEVREYRNNSEKRRKPPSPRTRAERENDREMAEFLEVLQRSEKAAKAKDAEFFAATAARERKMNEETRRLWGDDWEDKLARLRQTKPY